MGPLGISFLVSNTKINGGGWKGEADLVENDGKDLIDFFSSKVE